jgi:glycosyltransferase involved in cell wall biosynthesis
VSKVSFVIPTLNQAPFIRRCIDSCLAQELPDFEIIVRDGGSTDGTRQILADYGDRIQWTSENDAGQADAVNKGVQAAQGEIIAWINSDDYYADATVVRPIVDVFAVEREVDMVYGDGLFVDPAGNRLREFRGRSVESRKAALLYPGGFVLQPCLFFRRSLFMEVGRLNVDYHLALDFDLWLRMLGVARQIRYLPSAIACATVHTDAKSIKHVKRQLREIALIKAKHRAKFDLTCLDHLQMVAGSMKNFAYGHLVSLGLYDPWHEKSRS